MTVKYKQDLYINTVSKNKNEMLNVFYNKLNLYK